MKPFALLAPAMAILFAACIYDWTVPESDAPAAGGSGGTAPLGGGGAGGDPGDAGGSGGANTGGRGGAGGTVGPCTPLGTDNACETCAKSGCCNDLEACVGVTHCECIRDCIFAGLSNCAVGTCPGTSPQATALITCIVTQQCTSCGM